MAGIPPVLDTDSEDVAWALQTADALWKRAERADAVVWLRRAAQAAGESEDDDRALALARNAAELSDWVNDPRGREASRPPPPPPPPRPSIPTPSIDMVDELLARSTAESIDEVTMPEIILEPDVLEPIVETIRAPALPDHSYDGPFLPAPSANPPPGSFTPFTRASRVPPPAAPTQFPPSLQTRVAPEDASAGPVTPFGGAAPAPGTPQASPGAMSTSPPVDPAADSGRVSRLPWRGDAKRTARASSLPGPQRISSSPTPLGATRAPVAAPVLAPSPDPVAVAPPPVAPPAASVPAPAQATPPLAPASLMPSPLPPRTEAAAMLLATPRPPPLPPVPSAGAWPSPRPAAVLAVAPPPLAPVAEVADAPTAAELHAGMLDPWAEGGGRDGNSSRPSRPASASEFDTDEVVTSAPPVSQPPPAVKGSSPPARMDAPLGGAAAPLPPARMDAPFGGAAAPLPPARIEAPLAAPAARPARPDDRPGPARVATREALDLSSVEALGDMPDDARDAFARDATVRDLARGEKVTGFALALVLSGTVDVVGAGSDAVAIQLAPGAVVRGRGTLQPSMPLRLVASSDNVRLALWGERDVVDAFRASPWVEDELRAAGDRVQALVGLTLGRMGDRFDLALRTQVTSRLNVRALAEHEMVARAGEPIRGIVVVGAGELELLSPKGIPTRTVLRPGDFLFPGEILRAAPAPNDVRAAKGGALVLAADRAVAQELLVTCPPLLEIFAG